MVGRRMQTTRAPGTAPETVALPAPDVALDVRALSRLKACRLSFTQALLVRMIRERWQLTRRRWDLDDEGRGTATYEIAARGLTMTLILFSDRLRDEEQEERIVATRWDLMAALVEGSVEPQEIEELRREIPLVIDGRMLPRGLMWCRANRSSRIFDHTVERLAEGRQPELGLVADAGYLLRTLDFRANGLNGSRPLLAYARGHPLRGPFFAQMLGCYAIRQFSIDLVEHIASRRSGRARALDRDVARYLGIGNSSGIGLVLFLLAQPQLLDRSLSLRFTAQSRARAVTVRSSLDSSRLEEILARRIVYAQEDRTDYGGVFTPAERIAADLETVARAAGKAPDLGWGELLDGLDDELDAESVEAMHAVLIEAHPSLSDDLLEELVVEAEPSWVPAALPAASLLETLERHFGWALGIPVDAPEERHFFWYKSEEHEEPRLGVRGEESGDDHTIDVVADVHALAAALQAEPAGESVGRVLLRHPELRPIAQRAWAARAHPYHTPHMNSIARSFSPVDPMRVVLSGLKGLEKLYPMSDRWVRSLMLQGAPLADELAAGADPLWVYPPLPSRS
jgi:hypothetical protein